MWNVYCFEQPINVLEKATVVFNTGALVFFTMTCVLRFYLIVIRQPLPYEDTFMRPRYISALTLLGFLFTAFLVVLSWGGQYSYSRSGHCLGLILLAFFNQGSVLKSMVLQTHNQGVLQLFLTVCFNYL